MSITGLQSTIMFDTPTLPGGVSQSELSNALTDVASSFKSQCLDSLGHGIISSTIPCSLGSLSLTGPEVIAEVPAIFANRSLDPGNEFHSVSCRTTTSCMAVDSSSHSFDYNGLSWSEVKDIASTGYERGERIRVSCS